MSDDFGDLIAADRAEARQRLRSVEADFSKQWGDDASRALGEMFDLLLPSRARR